MSDILGPGFYFCSDLVDDVHLSVMSIGIVAFVMVLVFLACFISSFISSSSPHWIWGTQICRALCNVYPVVQWPSVSLLLWAFERDTWKKHKNIYIYSQIYWQLGVLQIASGCHNNIWTLDSQSEAAFVVPQCVFFFVGCSQDRRKEGSSLGKGQVSFHGVWPKQKLWVQKSEITDLVHLSFQKPEWNAKWDSHISMIWEYHHLVWNTKSCGLCRA